MTTLEQVKIRLKQFHMEKADGKDVVVFDEIENNPIIEQLIEQAKKDVIVIDELPYQVNKARLIELIANLAKDKQIDGIAEVRDESDREGIRVVIELKKDNRAELYLFTKILPNYLNYLRESGKNVILILEDIEVLYMDLYNLFKNDPTDIVYSFLREIQTICCNTNQGSIGTVCFKGAVSAVDIQFQKMIDNLNTELMLLSSTVIDSADKNSKKGVKTAIAGFNFKPVKTKAFSPLQNYLSLRLYNLLLQVN